VQTPEPLVPRAILDTTIALLEDLCGISSASGDAAGVRRVADRIGAELAARGLAVEISAEQDGTATPQPLLVARGPAAGDRYLLLVSHLDTVLPAIPPQRDGDRLIATGALDTKGGLAVLVGAIDLLASRGRKPPADLLLLAVPDEEANGTVSEAALARWGVAARTMLVLEPGEARGDAESVVAGRRGLTEWTLEVRGRASHSGLAYWEGRSALGAAAKWCAAALQLSERGPGVTVNVARLLAGDADFVDALEHNFALLRTSRRRNVVAERALAEGEVRYLSQPPGEALLDELRELARRLAAEHEVEMIFATGGHLAPVEAGGAGSDLVRRTCEIARGHGWQLQVEADRGGISFPNYVTDVARIPTVDGLGPVGGGMHTREEWVSLRSVERRIALLADLLATL
jgi:glutamate carboxypeptidase